MPRQRLHTVLLGFLFLLGVITLLQPADDAAANRLEFTPQTLQLPAENTPAESGTPQLLAETADQDIVTQNVTIQSGDTLSSLFDRLQLGAGELHGLMKSNPELTAGLRQIKPGETLRFEIKDGQQLHALHYARDRLHTLIFERNADHGFSAREHVHKVNHHPAYTTATITSSFFSAGQQAGLSDAMIMDLATVFGWDIDFALDIRSGDEFTVLYEQAYLDGERLPGGNILAAEFINQGRLVQAIRHVDEKGEASFYTPDGLSMRKAFLRAPVDFNRISSGFRPERHHPILGVKRPHRGVDYAAPTGTPIKASGDGKVEFVGTKGGYGKTIILQHGGTYRTLYGHMSRFNPKIRTGSRVRQGQVIGYVGMTGLATGPHLHYEFLVNGVHRNPVTVKLPTAEPIAEKYRTAFREQARQRLGQLETIKQTRLAMQEP